MSQIGRMTRRGVVLPALLVSALGVSACGAGGSSTATPSASSSQPTTVSSAPSSAASSAPSTVASNSPSNVAKTCGDVTPKAPGGTADLSALPAERAAAYDGYSAPVNTSVYANFPAKKGPFKIGYSDSFSANPWRAQALARLKKDVDTYKSAGLTVGLQATNSNLDNNLQIQQITSMINNKVDAIIAIPNSPTAFNGVIEQAYKAGIPFITVSSHVTSPDAINVDGNNFLTGEEVAAAVAKVIGGKGEVLMVDGIHGSPTASDMNNGVKAAFALCPNASVVGNLEGFWSDASAKTVTLQYLATHPSLPAAVVNAGAMTNGIVQAFAQSGKTLPPMGDLNPTQGGVVTMLQKLPDTSVASTVPPEEIMDGAFLTAIATLQGQGPKYDAIVGSVATVTGKTALTAWIGPSWKSTTTDGVPSVPSAPFLPQSGIGPFFTNPATLPPLS